MSRSRRSVCANLSVLLFLTACTPIGVHSFSDVGAGGGITLGQGVSQIAGLRNTDKVAVIVNAASRFYSDLDADIETIFLAKMIDRGLGVITRSDIESILAERDFQLNSGLTDREAAVVGKITNVELVALVTHDSKVCGDSRMWVRIVGVERGVAVWANRGSINHCSRREFEVAKLAQALANTIP